MNKLRISTWKKIPINVIDRLLKNAHRSPSTGHTQVQEYIVVIDPITKRKLCEASLGQSQVEDASVLIVVCIQTHQGLLIDTEKEAQISIVL